MHKSSIFSNVNSNTEALVLVKTPVKELELLEKLRNKGIKATFLNETFNTILVLTTVDDMNSIISGFHCEVLDMFTSIKDAETNQIIVVLSGNMKQFGDVSRMQFFNKELRKTFGNNIATLTYDNEVTYPDYLSEGIKNVIKRNEPKSFIQLHNMLLEDEGMSMTKYEAL